MSRWTVVHNLCTGDFFQLNEGNFDLFQVIRVSNNRISATLICRHNAGMLDETQQYKTVQVFQVTGADLQVHQNHEGCGVLGGKMAQLSESLLGNFIMTDDGVVYYVDTVDDSDELFSVIPACWHGEQGYVETLPCGIHVTVLTVREYINLHFGHIHYHAPAMFEYES